MFTFIWVSIIKGMQYLLMNLISSLGNNVGWGIIIFTIIVRSLLAPLSYSQERQSHFRQKSIAPKYGILEKKYPTRDSVSVQKLFEGRYQLQQQIKKRKKGHHHYTLLFIILQLFIIFALVSTIHSTKAIYHGTFLWVQLGHPDNLYILPVIATLLTICSQFLINSVNHSWNHFSKICIVIFPAFILFEGIFSTSALVLYWIALYIENIAQESFVGILWKYESKKNKIKKIKNKK